MTEREAAIKEVQDVIARALEQLALQQREAQADIENAVREASERLVERLQELVAEIKRTAEEIKRLRR